MKAALYTILACAIFCCSSFGADCTNLKDSGDGVPKEYYLHECEGQNAFAAGNYKVAARHFREALKIQKFEAPNYDLKLELGTSLCKLGKKTEGKQALRKFLEMSQADSKGELEFGSGLSEKGKVYLLERMAQANDVIKSCGRNP